MSLPVKIRYFPNNICFFCKNKFRGVDLLYVSSLFLVKLDPCIIDTLKRRKLPQGTFQAPYQLCSGCYVTFKQWEKQISANSNALLLEMNTPEYNNFVYDHRDVLADCKVAINGTLTNDGHYIPFTYDDGTFRNGKTVTFDFTIRYHELGILPKPKQTEAKVEVKDAAEDGATEPVKSGTRKKRSCVKYREPELTEICRFIVSNAPNDVSAMLGWLRRVELGKHMESIGHNKRSENGYLSIIKQIRKKKHSRIEESEDLCTWCDKVNEAIKTAALRKDGLCETGGADINLSEKLIKEKLGKNGKDLISNYQKDSNKGRKKKIDYKLETLDVKRQAVAVLNNAAKSMELISYNNEVYVGMAEDIVYEKYAKNKKERDLRLHIIEESPKSFVRLMMSWKRKEIDINRSDKEKEKHKEDMLQRMDDIFDRYSKH